MKAIAIFDFDGTIADTFNTGAMLINHFAERFGYKKIDFANNKDLSARQLIKMANVKFWHIPRLVRFFRKESGKRSHEIKPFDFIPNIMAQLNQMCDMGILTTNSAVTVNNFLKDNQLDNYFSFIKTDVPLFGKKRALRRVKRQLLKRYTHIIYIGDEIRDIEACRKADIDIVSVSWGYNSYKALKKVNSSIAETPEQLVELLSIMV